MRKIVGLLMVLGLGLAQGSKSSLAVIGGTWAGVVPEFGLEFSSNLPYQLPVGTLRSTVDLTVASPFLRGAFLVHYFYDLGQGLQVGGGLGLTITHFGAYGVSIDIFTPYLRVDVEYDLPVSQSLPIFLGADFGTDLTLGFLARAKLGFRF